MYRMTAATTSLLIRIFRWAVTLTVCVVFVVTVGSWAEKKEFQSKLQNIEQTAKAYSLALNGILEQHNYIPYAAALYPAVIDLLKKPNDRALQLKVNNLFSDLQLRTDSSAIFVMDRRGTTLASSNWNTKNSYVGQFYGQRPYFKDASAGKRGIFYGVGLTTGEPGLFIAEPVRSGSMVIGVVVIKVSLDALEKSWFKSPEPVFLSDSQGVIFLSSIPTWQFKSTKSLDANQLNSIKTHGQYGDRASFELLRWKVSRSSDSNVFYFHIPIDGANHKFMAINQELPDLGWTLTVTSNYSEVTQARSAAILIATLITIIVALGILYFRLREKRYVEQQKAKENLELHVKERTHDLQEANAFRKAMEDSLVVGMQAHDSTGSIIYVNPAFCVMTGYSSQELLGATPPYPYQFAEETDKPILDDGQPLNGHESRLKHKAGHEVNTMVYMAPLIDSMGKQRGFMSSIVDITAQKTAEMKQREQEIKMQRSARLASVGEMASTLAHELNQPLMALSNFAIAARAIATKSPPELLVSALDDIVEQSKRASAIVNRVRALINPARACYDEQDINQLISHSLLLLDHELKRTRVKVTTQLEQDLPKIRGDGVLIEQLLLNLVLNSAQAIHDLPAYNRHITVESIRADRYVEVVITDRGKGIPDEILYQVFTPFFTTKPDGLGLGLNICKTIVEAHGGHIVVENHKDGGAVFSLTLPIST